MSTRTVNRTISVARQDGVISPAEAKDIVAAAELSKQGQPTPVTFGEAKAVGDLYESRSDPFAQVPGLPIGGIAPPFFGNPNAPYIGGEAKQTLNAFFIRAKLPFGDAQGTLVADIQRALERADLGAPLSQKPDVSRMFAVRLPYPEGANDFPAQTAFYDPAKQEFFLQSKGGLIPNTEFWHGPVSLKDVDGGGGQTPALKQETIARAERAFSDVSRAGLIDWDGLPDTLPMGQRFVEVDAFAGQPQQLVWKYKLAFPAGALVPGGEKDPNEATKFYVRRVDLEGNSRVLGPIDLPTGGVRPDTIERIRQQVLRLERDGQIGWSSTPPPVPAGMGLTTVEIAHQGGINPQTTFAKIPSGGFPGTPPVDPNQASMFFLERRGLFGGAQYAGPFTLQADVGGPIVEHEGGAGSIDR